MFHGSIVALVTPMQGNGEIDFEGMSRLIDLHIEKGTHAIVVVGSTGEAATLNHEEKLKIIKHAVSYVKGRIPVIAGTGTYATRETIELTRDAMEAGVDGCLLVTPYYNKPTQEGLFQHYRAVAQAVPIPIILYNVPGRTACDLLPETVERLASFSNIVAIKESTSQLTRIQELIKRCGDQLDVLSGEDAPAVGYILNGAKGVISVTANVAPDLMQQMYQASHEGNSELAQRLNQKLMGLHKNLFIETNPIPVKWALYEMKLIPAGIRLPLLPLSERFHNVIRDSLRQAEVI